MGLWPGHAHPERSRERQLAEPRDRRRGPIPHPLRSTRGRHQRRRVGVEHAGERVVRESHLPARIGPQRGAEQQRRRRRHRAHHPQHGVTCLALPVHHRWSRQHAHLWRRDPQQHDLDWLLSRLREA